MSKKFSLIGFEKSKYKSIKYTNQTLDIGTFIKFYYGSNPDPKKLKPVIGKVSKIYPKGVELNTDYGIYHAEWSRIERLFQAKTSGKLKETKLFAVDGLSPLPLIDSAINRILTQIKSNHVNVDISDKKINSTTIYKRAVKIKAPGKKAISITIKSKDDTEAIIKGLKRNAVIKLNGKGKISSAIIKKVVNASESLAKPIKKGKALNIAEL